MILNNAISPEQGFDNHNYDDEKSSGGWNAAAVVILLVGFCAPPVWLCAICTMGRGKVPKLLGIVSLCYYCLAAIATIIIVAIVVTNNSAVDEATKGCRTRDTVTACMGDANCGWCTQTGKCTSRAKGVEVGDCVKQTFIVVGLEGYCNSFQLTSSKCVADTNCKSCSERVCKPSASSC